MKKIRVFQILTKSVFGHFLHYCTCSLYLWKTQVFQEKFDFIKNIVPEPDQTFLSKYIFGVNIIMLTWCWVLLFFCWLIGYFVTCIMIHDTDGMSNMMFYSKLRQNVDVMYRYTIIFILITGNSHHYTFSHKCKCASNTS